MPARTAFPAAARDEILAWYAARGRPLAFRRTADPYAILVSEAMAQQTQASRAAAYWERFMVRFPTVAALADASPADVLRAWQGLGYDRRALALRRAAIAIRADHGGQVPSSVEALRALPGVGPYTARAVAALAFGAPVGAVDVNVRRVLGRILGSSVAALTAAPFQDVADAAVPADQPGAWTHALMDVGATVCRPRVPRCGECPAAPWCRFAAGDRPTPPRRTQPTVPGSVDRSLPAPVPFHTTNRWLRGRILDQVRSVPDGSWTILDEAIGGHDRERVRSAATAMAHDGLLELADVGSAAGAEGPLRARLPLA